MTPLLIAQIVLTLFVFVMLLNSAAVMVYVERKVAALLQQRIGPYLVGPKGLLQPIADVIKLMFKEELRPRAADPLLFALAPIISATAAFAAFAVVPFGAEHDVLRPAERAAQAAGGRRQRRRPGDLRDRLDGRLRDRARRVELEQQVLAARRPALVGADDQLRAVVRPGAGQRAADRQLAVADRSRERAVGGVARLHPALVPVPAAARLPDLHDGRHRGDQPRAVRLSRKRSRSWSPATTPSTAA